MARGNEKLKAQARNLKNKASDKGSQKDAQKAGLKMQCPLCFTPMTNYNNMKNHYESKHPKATLPAEGDPCFECK